MTGSIIPKGKDTWKIVVSMGTGPDGKRRRHIETLHGRKSVAQKRINELLILKDRGIITPQARLTLAQHLRNWLSGYVATSCGPRTIDSYESIAERHIIPALGHYQLRQLNHQAIQEYYSEAQEPPKKLGPRTVAKHHRLLSQALKYAIRQGYVVRNPCDLVDPPKWQPRDMRALNKNEAALFLAEASSSDFYPVYYTALTTGLRQAELCGLTWRDIDTETTTDKDGNITYGTISVRHVLYKRRGVCEIKPPKTKRSSRDVKMTENLAKFLKEYKSAQQTLYWHVSDWQQINKPLPPDYFVFGFLDQPCSPSSLSHNFAAVARKAGLEGVNFHGLRHSFASLALAEGAPAKVVSEALGHASVAFTLQTYAKSLPGMQEKTMELLNDALPEGILQTGTKMTPETNIMLSQT